MKVNLFFTIFWMLYIPTCITFYHVINFQYIDEILTLILLLYTSGVVLNRKTKTIGKEVWAYTGVMAFYVLYSVMIHLTSINAIVYDFQQQIRPYIVFYCTYMLAPKLTSSQKRLLLVFLILNLLVFFTVAITMKSANLQVQQNPVVGQACLLSGLLYYFYSKENSINFMVAVGIVALGLFSEKAKFFGEFVAFVGVLFFMKSKFRLSSVKTILMVIVVAVISISLTWTKFNIYYVEGMQASQKEIQARPASYRTAATIVFKDYVPFGSGLGTFANASVIVYYSPLYYKYNLDKVWGLGTGAGFIADAFYPNLAQYGIVGLFLFFWFWRRRYLDLNKLNGLKNYRVALMCIAALLLESVADSSYLSGKGMGYFLLLATSLTSEQRRINRKSRRIIIINRRLTGIENSFHEQE